MYNYYCEEKRKKIKADQEKIESKERFIKDKRKSKITTFINNKIKRW